MKSLPSDEHTFTVKIKGSKTGRVYDGTFTFKLPTLLTETQISKTLARLNEGLTLDDDIEFLHEMLSYLSHTLIKYPDWWEKEAMELSIRDFNVYTEIRKNCVEFEKRWNDEVWADEQTGSKEKSQEDSTAS